MKIEITDAVYCNNAEHPDDRSMLQRLWRGIFTANSAVNCSVMIDHEAAISNDIKNPACLLILIFFCKTNYYLINFACIRKHPNWAYFIFLYLEMTNACTCDVLAQIWQKLKASTRTNWKRRKLRRRIRCRQKKVHWLHYTPETAVMLCIL